MSQPWWTEAVCYQIYPRSFNDSDGDGVGDLPGIRERVDYLDDLGVDAVWLSPVYQSPQADHGYDVADYRSIHDEYGTLADFDDLLEALHDRDIRLLMDLVVNHTSDEHEWFERSRRGEKPYDEYYYWRESEDGPPNNWESTFGGSAWTYDETREAYYLHLFDEKQPDLNWRNPRVREEVQDICQFWLDRGVDGFRMDVINLISKAEGLPDGVPNDMQVGVEHFWDGPNLEAYLQELHDAVLADPAIVAVGEMPGISAGRAQDFVGEDGPLSMVISFDHVVLDWGPDGRWDPTDVSPGGFQRALLTWQEHLAENGWPCLYLENHDQPRSVSRYGDDETYHYESATMLATVLLTLRGTPFVYQGQEIGMTNASFPDPSVLEDVETLNFLAETDDDYAAVRDAVEAQSRDNSRTPMQWDGTEQAGFTTGDPWLPVTDNYHEINAASARESDDSIWQFYRELIEFRAETPALRRGSLAVLEDVPEAVFAFERTHDGRHVRSYCNLTDAIQEVSVEVPVATVVGNYRDPQAGESLHGDLELRPYEALVCDLTE